MFQRFMMIQISNGHNFFSIAPNGLKFCTHLVNIRTSMHAKFQPIRSNRIKVMAVRNFDCLEIHQCTILKNLIRNHLVAACPPGSCILAILFRCHLLCWILKKRLHTFVAWVLTKHNWFGQQEEVENPSSDLGTTRLGPLKSV